MAGKGTIGAKIVLEGEAQYKKALQDIKTAQSQLRSEMKLCSTEFKTSQNSLQALEKKHQILSKQVEQSARKVKTYEQALQASQAKEKAAADAVDKARKEYEDAAKAMEKMAKAGDATNDELDEQQRVVDGLKDKLSVAERNYNKAAENTQKYQTSLNYANAELTEMTESLAQNDKYMAEAEKSADGVAHSIDEYGNEVKEATDQTNIFGEVLKANLTSQAIISAVKGLASAMGEIASACIETGMEFEASMSKVQALSGSSGKELEALTEKAKEMGASTMYSASEAADALSYMALAGWDTKSMLDGIEPILSLAAAANMDLAQASDIVTDSLTAFGLTAQDAGKFSDQMAYAMANSNTDVIQLGEAYKNCAAAAGSMNYSVEDVTSALMTMANAGVKGGEAGTALRGIMINLATDTNGCADKLRQFGVEIYDSATGKMKPLSDVLIQTAGAFDGLSDSEKNALAKTIAGKTQFTGLQTILLGMNDAAKASGMSFEDYAQSLQDCDGYAKQMADTMQDNLKGKLTILDSSMQALQESTYELFDETMKEGVDAATDAISRLNTSVKSGSMHVSLARLSKSFGDFTSKAIVVAEDGLPKLIDGFTWFLDNMDDVAAMFISVAGTIKGMQIVDSLTKSFAAFSSSTENATIAQWALNAALGANPMMALTAAVVAATTALGAYAVMQTAMNDGSTEATKTTERLADSYRDMAEGIKSSQKERADSIEGIAAEAQIADDLAKRLYDLNGSYSDLAPGTAAASQNMAEQKEIIAQLNQIYPDLNLAIDEQTGALNMGNTELRDRIDLLKQQAKAEAMQEYLVEIAQEQIEAKKKLKGATEELQTAEDNEKQALEEYNAQMELSKQLTGENANAVDEAKAKYIKAQEATNDLKDAQKEAKDALYDLNVEYDATASEIESTKGVIDDTAGAMDGMADSADGAANAVRNLKLSGEELEDFQKAVDSAVDGAMGAFQEWEDAAEQSPETLQKNLDSQIEGLQQWADDFEELAKKGIDDGLLQTLAEMGPEAEGYIQGLLKMADDGTLADFSDKWGEAMMLKEETKIKIVETYQTAGTESIEAYVEGAADAATDTTEIESAANEQADAFVDTLEDSKDDARQAGQDLGDETGKGLKDDSKLKADAEQAGKDTDANLKKGIESEQDKPKKAAETVAKNIVTAVKENLSGDAMYQAGYDAMKMLAQGISEGAQLVQTAADKAATAAKVTPTTAAAGQKENAAKTATQPVSKPDTAPQKAAMRAVASDIEALGASIKNTAANANITNTISDASITKLANEIVDGIKGIDTRVQIGDREFGRIVRKAVYHG